MSTIVLPILLSAPLRVLPGPLRAAALPRLLNLLLSAERSQGELDFLEGRTLRIEVEDADLGCSISLRNRQLVAGQGSACDIMISGNVYDFLLLIAREEDSDTLFFQRRIKLQGDTELGLFVKNFLDGLELDSLPFYRRGQPLLRSSIRLLERVGRRPGPGRQIRAQNRNPETLL